MRAASAKRAVGTISSKPATWRGVRVTPTTRMPSALSSFADRDADDADADDHRGLAVERAPNRRSQKCAFLSSTWRAASRLTAIIR